MVVRKVSFLKLSFLTNLNLSQSNMNYFAHPTAIIDDGAKIGQGTKIWHWVHVSSTATIGENCVLGQNVFIGSQVVIGNQVKIQNNVSVYEGVILEDDVFCGPSMVFTNVINPRSFIERKQEFRKTLVKRGATLGANATIICGHTIGCYALIGAGSVVTKDVPDYALMVGNPAKLVGRVCHCGARLKLTASSRNMKEFSPSMAAVCNDCGKSYLVTKEGCQLFTE